MRLAVLAFCGDICTLCSYWDSLVREKADVVAYVCRDLCAEAWPTRWIRWRRKFGELQLDALNVRCTEWSRSLLLYGAALSSLKTCKLIWAAYSRCFGRSCWKWWCLSSKKIACVSVYYLVYSLCRDGDSQVSLIDDVVGGLYLWTLLYETIW